MQTLTRLITKSRNLSKISERFRKGLTLFSSVVCLTLNVFFPCYSTISEKKLYWAQNVFWFSVQILSETFIFLGRIQRDAKSSCKVNGILCRSLMRFKLCWQSFEKFSRTKFHENPSSGSRIVPCELMGERTDRHDGTYSRFAQFCWSS